jgi:hypothetical protein
LLWRVVATRLNLLHPLIIFTQLFLLVSCMSFFAWSQAQQASEPAGKSVSGTVLNSVSREPVGRVMVYSADQRYATFTDEHGRFEINLAETETPAVNVQIPLDVRRPGFRSRGSNLVRWGEENVTMWLVPQAVITGRVKFPSEEPGDHVEVQLYHREVRDGLGQWVAASRDQTRVDGEFRFADLEPGDYKVFTLENMEQGSTADGSNQPAWGFPPRFFPAARDFAGAETIHLRAGQMFAANISLERQRYYEVRVPVMSTEPGIRGGMGVSVYTPGHRGPGYELGFSPREQVVSGLLPDGTYTIEARGYGQNAVTGATSITVANRPAIGPPLSVVANSSIQVNIRKDLSGIDATKRQGIVDSSGTSAQVWLTSAEDFSEMRGMTYYAQGEPLKIAGVAPGRYWVQVRVFGGYAATVGSGGIDLLREPLIVPVGASVPPIDITLRYDTGELQAKLEGVKERTGNSPNMTITGSTGSVANLMQGGLSIYCLPLDGYRSPEMSQVNVMNGEANWMQLPPGRYLVLAFSSPRELEYRNQEAMEKYDSLGQVVKVVAGQKAQTKVRVIENE